MSVRQETASSSPSLGGTEGELVRVRVCVKPRLLEALLDTLAGLSFSVNPQIFHQAGIGHVYADGREELHPITMVEFPAFSSRLSEVDAAIQASKLPPGSLHIRSMFEDIHSDYLVEAAPEGAPYGQVRFYRRLPRG